MPQNVLSADAQKTQASFSGLAITLGLADLSATTELGPEEQMTALSELHAAGRVRKRGNLWQLTSAELRRSAEGASLP